MRHNSKRADPLVGDKIAITLIDRPCPVSGSKRVMAWLRKPSATTKRLGRTTARATSRTLPWLTSAWGFRGTKIH